MATLILAGSTALAQAVSSDWTTGMPSVATIEAKIQGTDPVDTAERQVGFLDYMQHYIDRIKEARDYNGPYLPNEQKLRVDYYQAQTDLTQNYAKTHSAAELKLFQGKALQYSINNAEDWIRQLQGQQAASANQAAHQSLTNSYNKVNSQYQNNANPQAAGNVNLNADQKRCLELGDSFSDCVSPLMDMIGALGSVLAGVTGAKPQGPPPLNGVVFVGKYHSRTQLPVITLNNNSSVTLSNCGALMDLLQSYTIRKSGARTQIVMSNEPSPIVLTVNPDNSLTGPGTVQVKGNVIVGYNNFTTTRTGNCAPNCVSGGSTPVTQAKIESCSIGALGRDTPLPSMFVAGDYTSSSGLLLSFNGATVTLDCGKAHIKAPYAVDDTPSGFVVRIQKPDGTFSLTALPDNTLRGSGSAVINGKLVSSVSGTNVSFAPHSETCNVGTFTPKGNEFTMAASQ